jgi:hypothetical protein
MKTLPKQIPIGWIIVLIAVLIQLLVSFKVVQATFSSEQPRRAHAESLYVPATSLISTTTTSNTPSSTTVFRAPVVPLPGKPPFPFPWQGGRRDTDRDGIPNVKDKDIDNDGLLNGSDPNVDGSVNSQLMLRLVNALETATTTTKPVSFARMLIPHIGDLMLNSDPRELDIDGDGFIDTAVTELDIDGDFLRDTSLLETDIDGDGVPDVTDDDIDGDAVANAADPDRDGDARPNDMDADPNGIEGSLQPCKAPPLIPKRPVLPPSTTTGTPAPAK